ncbi:MAG: efflux RND transporter periplasmic adaptor subunit [Ignavibacteria bacterium]|nr:efflux RND transporter periplasmic adaptor subunit [Ignavibacteria bacterium]
MKSNKTLWFIPILILVAVVVFAMRRQEKNQLNTKETTNLPRVQVEKPQRKSVSSELQLNGDVLPWQQATLYSKVAGYLREIKVDKGDFGEERRRPCGHR